MSDTPRTDAVAFNMSGTKDYPGHLVQARFARQLETELAAEKARADAAERQFDSLAIVLVLPTGTDPFARADCNRIDYGRADNVVTVACPEATQAVNERDAFAAQVATLRNALAASKTALEFCYERASEMTRRVWKDTADRSDSFKIREVSHAELQCLSVALAATPADCAPTIPAGSPLGRYIDSLRDERNAIEVKYRSAATLLGDRLRELFRRPGGVAFQRAQEMMHGEVLGFMLAEFEKAVGIEAPKGGA